MPSFSLLHISLTRPTLSHLDPRLPFGHVHIGTLVHWYSCRPGEGWEGFEGFDWDIEGNDDGAHHGNLFQVNVLDLMGEMSTLAKRDGYLVAMAPAQSYLDPGTSEFSRHVNLPPREDWQPTFFYAGRNTYAYILHVYGEETFDFISIQLYEGWSSANYAISTKGVDPATYIASLVQNVTGSNGHGDGDGSGGGDGGGGGGWVVDFSTDPDSKVNQLGRQRIRIKKEQLVIGLANGWTTPPPNSKFLLLWPEACVKAFNDLRGGASGTRDTSSAAGFLGYMYWNLGDEGNAVELQKESDGGEQGKARVLHLARELNPIFAN